MTKLPEVEFEVGQMVYLIGHGFKVITRSHSNKLPLRITGFGNLTKNGYFYSESTDRCILTLEEAAKLGLFPPKKKVKKTLECWLNVYPDGFGVRCHTKEKADEGARSDRIDCIQVKHEIEVEE